MKTLQITHNQVNEICKIAAEKYEVIDRTTYVNVIDKKTRQSSLEGGDYNFVTYHLRVLVEQNVLKYSNKNYNEAFDWMSVGVNTQNDNFNYVTKVYREVIKRIANK